MNNNQQQPNENQGKDWVANQNPPTGRQMPSGEEGMGNPSGQADSTSGGVAGRNPEEQRQMTSGQTQQSTNQGNIPGQQSSVTDQGRGQFGEEESETGMGMSEAGQTNQGSMGSQGYSQGQQSGGERLTGWQAGSESGNSIDQPDQQRQNTEREGKDWQ